MSGIGSIGGCASPLTQYLSQLSVASDGSTQSTVGSNSSPSLGASAPSGLKDSLLSAISDALQNAPSTDSPQDLFQAIYDAIDKALRANGIDPTQLARGQGGGSGSQAAALLMALLSANGQDGSSADLTSLLSGAQQQGAGSATSPSAIQDSLVQLLQSLPAGLNLNVQG
jgi:hypothetical protein